MTWVKEQRELTEHAPCVMPPNNTTGQARKGTVDNFTTVSFDFFSEKVTAMANVIGVHGADGHYRKDCEHLQERKEHHHRRTLAKKREAFFSQDEMEAPLAPQQANILLRNTLGTDSSSDNERKSSVKYLGGGWLEEPSSSLQSPTRSSPHLRELSRPRRPLPPPPRSPIRKNRYTTFLEQLGRMFQGDNSQHQEEASECEDKQPRLWLF